MFSKELRRNGGETAENRHQPPNFFLSFLAELDIFETFEAIFFSQKNYLNIFLVHSVVIEPYHYPLNILDEIVFDIVLYSILLNHRALLGYSMLYCSCKRQLADFHSFQWKDSRYIFIFLNYLFFFLFIKSFLVPFLLYFYYVL